MFGRRKKRRKRHGSDGCDCDFCDCDLPFCDLMSLSTLMRLMSLPPRTPKGYDRVVTGAIRGYRRVSPRLPTRCRYEPTCSAYGLAAVTRYGAGRGLRLTAARLARCRPGVAYGTVDPVP
ncbi:membrane protein insertion efficiency factor YidD [Micromonosporaceae bacterium Da 78-11]